MQFYAITAIFMILLCIEISLADNVLLHNSHNHHAACCIAKAIQYDAIEVLVSIGNLWPY